MVLAKRGTRAGVTRRVEQGVGYRDEPVTTIPLRHADDDLVMENGNKIRSLMWHSRDPDAPKSAGITPAMTGHRKWEFSEFHVIFPRDPEKALASGVLLRVAQEIEPELTRATFYRLLGEWAKDGMIVRVVKGPSMKYHRAL